jgi:anti-sigma regulatory factor (Ser/Thr protein kinase)
MMELSMHVLDVVENSTRAGAQRVTIAITEDRERDDLTIVITDDGAGMEPETLKKVLDPFYTSKTVRRVGLGLPMFFQAVQKADGNFSVESKAGEGTKVSAHFKHSHIDRQPLGDMANTMVTLIAGCPDVEFVYIHQCTGSYYTLDTSEIKQELEDVPINNTSILQFIQKDIIKGLKEIGADH